MSLQLHPNNKFRVFAVQITLSLPSSVSHPEKLPVHFGGSNVGHLTKRTKGSFFAKSHSIGFVEGRFQVISRKVKARIANKLPLL